jgi:hypothetical protein
MHILNHKNHFSFIIALKHDIILKEKNKTWKDKKSKRKQKKMTNQ